MLYRENPKNGDMLSQLGFGCMRLPRRGASIDIRRSTEIIHSAIEQGVNYFDTAYLYPGNEAALGKALSGGFREKVKIATKLPIILTHSGEDFEKFFSRQLDRLQTSYIDYYLAHMLTSFDQYEKCMAMGLDSWLKRQKESGRIINIGFSFHGKAEDFRKIIDAYTWDFCMIQYNYIDENYQAGKAGLLHAHQKGLPVMVMEPLRGGKLVTGLPGDAIKAFAAADPAPSAAEWGLKWVWNHPEVTLLLSGMGAQEQLDENIRIASYAKANALSQTELLAYEKVQEIMRRAVKVNCTGCGYCLPCPAGVDIPGCFSQYNDISLKGRLSARMHYMVAQGVISDSPGFASLCKRCGNCEKHCPQNIKIMDTMETVTKEIEPFWLKPLARAGKFFVGK